MLQSLLLQSIRSFGERLEVPLSPITLIYGPNSAGKSTLIQSLALLKQTIEGADPQDQILVVRGQQVDLGSFKSLIHRHDLSRNMVLGLSFERPRNMRFMGRIGLPDAERKLEFAFRWSPSTSSVELINTRLGLGQMPSVDFSWMRRLLGRADPGGQRSTNSFTIQDADRNSFIAFCRQLVAQKTGLTTASMANDQERVLDLIATRRADPFFYARGLLPGPLRELDMGHVEVEEDEEETNRRVAMRAFFFWDNLSRNLSQELDRVAADITYLGPMRHAPQRFHIFSGALRQNVGTEGEFATEVLARNKYLLNTVNKWLGQLGIPYELTINRLSDHALGETIGDVISLVLHDKRNGIPVAPNDVGFGISQLLPIVVQSLFLQRSIICIEQPEIHVHPALQAELGDLFVESALTTGGNQFIIETHSEHLMLRIQKKIREGGCPPDAVSVLYVRPTEEGNAQVVPLSLGERGEFLDEWPQGFFEERFNELFR